MPCPDRVDVAQSLMEENRQGAGTHANPSYLQGFLDAFKAGLDCVHDLGASVAGTLPNARERALYPLSRRTKADQRRGAPSLTHCEDFA
jgi:hypothetical protein